MFAERAGDIAQQQGMHMAFLTHKGIAALLDKDARRDFAEMVDRWQTNR